MIIRPVCHDDVPAVIALLNREILGGLNIFRLVPLDETMAMRWWSLHGQGRYQAVVAEVRSESDGQSRVAGWASLAPHSAYEGYDRTAEMSVWVDQDHRGIGFGKALVTTLLNECPSRRIRTVISRIESNNLASIRLHESCGFKRVGLLEDVGEKFGQSLSVALMQYHVTAG
jgi:L-amino acid N-acyltransferase